MADQEAVDQEVEVVGHEDLADQGVRIPGDIIEDIDMDIMVDITEGVIMVEDIMGDPHVLWDPWEAR